MWGSILGAASDLASRTTTDAQREEALARIREQHRNIAMIGNSSIAGGPPWTSDGTTGTRGGFPYQTRNVERVPEVAGEDMVANMRLTKIENGQLLHIVFEQGEVYKTFFIKNLDEIEGIIVSQMAARRMK